MKLCDVIADVLNLSITKVSMNDNFVSLGGDSRPRNEIIMKLFRLLGAAERQGFGGPLIFKTALQYDYRSPELDTNLESTELRVWNIDLADSYPELSKEDFPCLTYTRDLTDWHDFIRRTPEEYEAWIDGASRECETLELKILSDMSQEEKPIFVGRILPCLCFLLYFCGVNPSLRKRRNKMPPDMSGE